MMSGSIILTEEKSTREVRNRERNENNVISKTKSSSRERRSDVRR